MGWVLEARPWEEGDDPFGQPWVTLLWSYPKEFAAAVAAYQAELEFEIQAKEIADDDRVTFTRQATRYGPDHKPFVEAIFNRDARLRDLRRGRRAALDSGDVETARSICIQIGELLDGWVSGKNTLVPEGHISTGGRFSKPRVSREVVVASPRKSWDL